MIACVTTMGPLLGQCVLRSARNIVHELIVGVLSAIATELQMPSCAHPLRDSYSSCVIV
jgi:hypothetical protein